MSTAGYVRKHIHNLPEKQIFVTRELLHYGPRAAVDQIMYRLVALGEIVRLAWGVFIKPYPGFALPSISEVANYKAKAFDKRVFIHGQDAARELDILKKGNVIVTFDTDASSSSTFNCPEHFQRVRFKATAPRRLFAGDKRLGKVIRSLWHLGKRVCNQMHVQKATINLNRAERHELHKAAHQIPSWLVSLIRGYDSS